MAAFVARCLSRNLITAVLLAVVVIASGAYLGKNHSSQIVAAMNTVRDRALTPSGKLPNWPPVLNEPYPDLELLDQNGNPTRLSDFAGKIILLEPIGMSCPACIAFAGGRTFAGVAPQPNLQPIEAYVRRFGGVDLDDPRIVFVQLILFNPEMRPPTTYDVTAWASHFGMKRERNRVVLAGTSALADEFGMALVPGFQLIDKNSVLRCDSTGHAPRHDLYRDLLPQIRTLLNEPATVNRSPESP